MSKLQLIDRPHPRRRLPVLWNLARARRRHCQQASTFEEVLRGQRCALFKHRDSSTLVSDCTIGTSEATEYRAPGTCTVGPRSDEREPSPGATLTSANLADPPRKILVTGYRVAAESCATDSFRNDHRNSMTTYMQHQGAHDKTQQGKHLFFSLSVSRTLRVSAELEAPSWPLPPLPELWRPPSSGETKTAPFVRSPCDRRIGLFVAEGLGVNALIAPPTSCTQPQDKKGCTPQRRPKTEHALRRGDRLQPEHRLVERSKSGEHVERMRTTSSSW